MDSSFSNGEKTREISRWKFVNLNKIFCAGCISRLNVMEVWKILLLLTLLTEEIEHRKRLAIPANLAEINGGTQQTFTSSKSIIETPERGLKYVDAGVFI